jgi:hypothetical protein
LPSNVGQIRQDLRVLGLQDQRPPVIQLSLVILAQLEVAEAQVEEGLQVIGLQRHRLAVASDGCFQLAQRLIYSAQVAVKGCLLWPQLRGLGHVGHGFLKAARLVAENAQKMQSLRLVGLESQHLAVGRLRLLQIPRLMVADGHFQSRYQRIGCHLAWIPRFHNL